jgi:N-hydroxyarylamine O-acetyltransferase
MDPDGRTGAKVVSLRRQVPARGFSVCSASGLHVDPERYLARIGLDPEEARPPTAETLARLQRAHVTTVPFETLSITGDPFGGPDGEGVSLDLRDLYEKLVVRERGGFCYELNGLFAWLLGELGFDAVRLAAQVVDDEGDPRPPANHHAVGVALEAPHLVDVGLGLPKMRRPLPVGGRAGPDAAGIEWRTIESDRPDADGIVQTRREGEGSWGDRYLFTTTPRDLSYFEATCEHLAAAPESNFTGDPYVNVGTDRGHKTLSVDALAEVVDGEKREREVAPEEWHDVLASEFGLRHR